MTSLTLFDFSDPSAARAWRSIDDVVMGGRSASALEFLGDRAAFRGFVSLENNGGFASVRCLPRALGLAGQRGLELDLIGDGHACKLGLRLDDDFDGITYQATFTAPAGRRSLVRVDFAELVPTFRGRRVPGAPAFEPARATQLGLLVGDKQAGPFSLELFAIRSF
ncbi:MAG: CIA30 family protein [Planctomycetota bacterium]|nr:CIA30 family protein [Planctomycetota bacterium]